MRSTTPHAATAASAVLEDERLASVRCSIVSLAHIHHSQPEIVLASNGPVVCFLHRGEPAVAQITLLRSQLHATLRSHPDGIGLLFIIAESSTLPDSDVRTAVAATFKELGPKIVLLGAAMEGVGFGPAAKRSVFTLVSSSVFGAVRMKVLGSAAEACDWMDTNATKAGLKSPSAIELIALVEKAKATK
jgi:hypothetical protein